MPFQRLRAALLRRRKSAFVVVHPSGEVHASSDRFTFAQADWDIVRHLQSWARARFSSPASLIQHPYYRSLGWLSLAGQHREAAWSEATGVHRCRCWALLTAVLAQCVLYTPGAALPMSVVPPHLQSLLVAVTLAVIATSWDVLRRPLWTWRQNLSRWFCGTVRDLPDRQSHTPRIRRTQGEHAPICAIVCVCSVCVYPSMWGACA